MERLVDGLGEMQYELPAAYYDSVGEINQFLVKTTENLLGAGKIDL